MKISRKAAIGALMGAIGMQFSATADVTLTGEITPGRKVYYNQNVILDNAILNGRTEITVYNGNIIVENGGVSNHAFTATNGAIGDSTACNATTNAIPGQNGRNGYTLILRTAGGTSGGATGNIEVDALVNLSGYSGGSGGRGRNGQHYDGSNCCQVQPGNGANGGSGGHGGSLLIYSNNNVTFTAAVNVSGGSGNAGGDAGTPYVMQATSVVPRPGKGGTGAAAGDIKVFARNNIFINNNIGFDAFGGDGSNGGEGGQTAFSSVGGDGGAGGAGGDVLFHSKYVGPDTGYTGSLVIRSSGGYGAAGGAGGGGNGYGLGQCGGAGLCESLTALRGVSAFGGRGGKTGSGGLTQMIINGDIYLPPPSPFSQGLKVYSNAGHSPTVGSLSGSTPAAGAVQQAPPNCACQLARAGTDGRNGADGGHGGHAVLKGHTLTLNACLFELQGGAGGTAAAGGDVASTGCGTVPLAGNGGKGGFGGNGGSLSLTAQVGMNCVDGIATLCGGMGGDGGNAGWGGGCPFGAIGGEGGSRGMDGWLMSLGSGVRPDEQSCTHIVDGADGLDSCP